MGSSHDFPKGSLDHSVVGISVHIHIHPILLRQSKQECDKRPFGDLDGRNDHGGGGEATLSRNL